MRERIGATGGEGQAERQKADKETRRLGGQEARRDKEYVFYSKIRNPAKGSPCLLVSLSPCLLVSLSVFYSASRNPQSTIPRRPSPNSLRIRAVKPQITSPSHS